MTVEKSVVESGAMRVVWSVARWVATLETMMVAPMAVNWVAATAEQKVASSVDLMASRSAAC